ncbi:3-methyladenine DNA glycosylase Tag [Rhizobium leguminosarum]|uniref:3-methyladenine DNA glycosylase Tag n=1 Tax=Rhizobium leguminosarum TaxID=384 RepID=A0AAE2SU40_RHILE|nr:MULTISPECIES: DNA-3-methyladenine glycosylase I [Rhizobium]MBB4288356.1 3-methyladenine DNA glycosylase Tag [Rhizobium leguminosarum]MBB4295551.1 3-methyladenine DNA glycosylase Tag [Rhizobium leguminosarum]MBB4306945.1 3-methyladenine DNA glycosylase Tag [Rhizobium leguminosarum]MBB4417473.1 3-methyladenine DNA glycosylase Tag [Rhizobium leguminosarum]MBB4432317.1 3-methyladenine DNA glycosylase Tag [Rhizobium esperanzae]
MISFEAIRQRAEQRKGGAAALQALLEKHRPDHDRLRAISDDRILADMTRRIFYSGFVQKVIDAKWPGFEAAFAGFDPAALNIAPDDYWHALMSDERIIRNGAKIMSVRANAAFIRELAREHGSAGAFFADWPREDQIGLLELLSKRGSRLGGMTGQYFLRGIGRDSFVATMDVLACLRSAGVPLSSSGTAKKDQKLIQEAFNHWADETGLSFIHLSRISAYSIDAAQPH